ncbi:MAG: sulfur oxidation c-type cytochrome SoxX [Aquificae bacterium]|nr:sulfur oxidation c-type cytochrome SoxX [Aquificota bacterium]
MKRGLLVALFASAGIIACQPASQAVKQEKQTLSAQAKTQEKVDKAQLFRKALNAQDKWQKACSNPTQIAPEGVDVAQFIKEMKETIKYPKDGKLVGDWKKGESLALLPKEYKALYGTKGGSRKGNCYACHCGDPRIIACGNIGPSLRGYGNKGIDPKLTYDRIYNSWAQVPCSTMFRFGYHGLLSPEEIAHIVGYLHDPESPINK